MRHFGSILIASLGALALFVAACSGDDADSDGKSGRRNGKNKDNPGVGGEAGGGGSGGVYIPIQPGGQGSQGGSAACDPDDRRPESDQDGDGFTVGQGDCNDCNASVNPGALEIPNNGRDDDCDPSTPDEVDPNASASCDTSLVFDSSDPMDAARAIGLCQTTTLGSKKWGVISAKYVQADGTGDIIPVQHGLLRRLGSHPSNEPREGQRLLALSTGSARNQPSRIPASYQYRCDECADPGQRASCEACLASGDSSCYTPCDNGWFLPASFHPMGVECTAPEPFPKASAACPDLDVGAMHCKDPAALELEILVPSNAGGFRFWFNFFTSEFPRFICSSFNDYYVTLVYPKPERPAGLPQLPDNNISFDREGNTIGVNNAMLEVCDSTVLAPPAEVAPGGRYFSCSQGLASLEDTGFDDSQSFGPHAATGWLYNEAPVKPGTVMKIRFAIWDSGDGSLDSTVLIDGFEWIMEPVEDIVTGRPLT